MTLTRDDYINEALHQARGMIFNLARNYALEFDDLLQDAAIVVLETVDRAMAMNRPFAYLQRAIRNVLLQRISQQNHCTSIDAPLSDDTDTCIADLLPAPPDVYQAQDDERASRREQVLYAALRRLPLEEQMYMRRVHMLNAFQPVPHDWSYKPKYNRSTKTLSLTAYKRLRKDYVLAAQVVCS